MKKIVLVDPFWNGHHPTYFKLISKTLLESGHFVVALCPEPEEMKEWISLNCSQQFLPYFNSFHLEEAKTVRSPIPRLQPALSAISLWLAAKHSIEAAINKLEISPDLVFLAWLDSYLGRNLVSPIIDWIFPYPWTGLYFTPRHLRSEQRYIFLRHGPLNPCAVLQSANCTSVAVLDEGIAEKLEKRIRKPVIILPDFSDSSQSDSSESTILQAILSKSQGKRVIGLLGVLAKRKGVLTLAEIAQRCIDRNYFFIFIGKLDQNSFSEEELSRFTLFIKSNPDNCYFHLERLTSESEFNSVIKLCSILFAVYHDFPHSSNLLTKAAIFEKPIIVNKEDCMGERVRHYRLGVTVAPQDIEQCLKAIDYLLNQRNEFLALQPKFCDYREVHSISNLRHKLEKILDS